MGDDAAWGMLGDRRRGFGAEGCLGLVLAEVRPEAVGAGASKRGLAEM